jgi:hypothetical protein
VVHGVTLIGTRNVGQNMWSVSVCSLALILRKG